MKKIVRALHEATTKYPYYARGFAALTPIERTIDIGGGPTLGVDKYWRLYWSEEALDKIAYHYADVLRHELEHLLRDHSGRCGGRNPRGWNYTADAEINDDLSEMPSDCIYPSSFKPPQPDGKTAEYYYERMEEEADKNGFCEGSGVTGHVESWEEGAPNDAAPGVSDACEAKIMRDAIANDVRDAHAKDPGSVPAGILVWAEARAVGGLPKMSWKRYVSAKLRRITRGREDWSYARRSRRQDRRDKIILPGTVKYTPNLSVVLDTSGSMQNQANWVAGILQDLSKMQTHVTLIDCDAAVHATRALHTWRDILKSRGGGGTDMREGIDYATRVGADMIIVLSDGYTPWPEPWPHNCVALICGENEEDPTKIYDSRAHNG